MSTNTIEAAQAALQKQCDDQGTGVRIGTGQTSKGPTLFAWVNYEKDAASYVALSLLYEFMGYPVEMRQVPKGGPGYAATMGHEATSAEATRIDIFKESRYGYIVGFYAVGVVSPRTGGLGWFALVGRIRPDGHFGGIAIHPGGVGLARKLYEWYGPKQSLSSADVTKHAHSLESWWLPGFFSDIRFEGQSTIHNRNARRDLRDAMRFSGWPPYEKVG